MNDPCLILYQGSLVQGWPFFRWVGPERSIRTTTREGPEEVRCLPGKSLSQGHLFPAYGVPFVFVSLSIYNIYGICGLNLYIPSCCLMILFTPFTK